MVANRTISTPWRKIPVVEIDLGKRCRNLPGFQQHPATQENADWNQREAENEESGKDEEENDPKIGIVVRAADQLHPASNRSWLRRTRW